MKSSNRPLIELADGRSQDKRSDLVAAFRRVVAMSNRRQVTDLHVRELLTYVHATDHDGNGVQKGIEELADMLVVAVSTCRNVIKRAELHFKLLTVTEQRNVRGGQTVNRFKINWDRVRLLNVPQVQFAHDEPGATTYHPPAMSDHPPDISGHPPATRYQPTNPTLTLTSSLQETTTTQSTLRTARCDDENDSWKVVVVSLEGVNLAKAAEAVQGAKRLGFTPDHCMALIEHWKASDHRNVPGVLFRWFTMARSAPSILKAKTKYVDRELQQTQRLNSMVEARRRVMIADNGGRPLTDEQRVELEAFAGKAAETCALS